jgi:hypothetical protein
VLCTEGGSPEAEYDPEDRQMPRNYQELPDLDLLELISGAMAGESLHLPPGFLTTL